MNLWKFLERGRNVQPEIISSRNGHAVLTPEQMRAAFAVSNDQLQWRATHQALDAEIQVCLRAAVDLTMQPPACACEVAAIEHLERVKRTLEELREYGLKSPGT